MKKRSLKVLALLSTMGCTLLLSSSILFNNDRSIVAHGGWQPGPGLLSTKSAEIAHGGWQPGPGLLSIKNNLIL